MGMGRGRLELEFLSSICYTSPPGAFIDYKFLYHRYLLSEKSEDLYLKTGVRDIGMRKVSRQGCETSAG